MNATQTLLMAVGRAGGGVALPGSESPAGGRFRLHAAPRRSLCPPFSPMSAAHKRLTAPFFAPQ